MGQLGERMWFNSNVVVATRDFKKHPQTIVVVTSGEWSTTRQNQFEYVWCIRFRVQAGYDDALPFKGAMVGERFLWPLSNEYANSLWKRMHDDPSTAGSRLVTDWRPEHGKELYPCMFAQNWRITDDAQVVSTLPTRAERAFLACFSVTTHDQSVPISRFWADRNKFRGPPARLGAPSVRNPPRHRIPLFERLGEDGAEHVLTLVCAEHLGGPTHQDRRQLLQLRCVSKGFRNIVRRLTAQWALQLKQRVDYALGEENRPLNPCVFVLQQSLAKRCRDWQ